MRWLLRGINFLGFAGNILYELFILIDSIVYSIAAYAIQAFFAIAELDFVANGFEQISYILGRIMILCGVFALFKLSFTLINYIIDPGKTNKSAETGTKLVKNILIAIVLLVSLNLIFNSLYKFQNSIIKNNVIPKIIYGADNYDSNGQEMDIKKNAKKFVNTIFVSLMLGGNSNENLSIPAKNAVDRVLDGASINLLSPYATDSGFNYLPFISFIVGVLVCYYFLVFAIELGIRMVKLLVLQILAPIPIIMSIDPTQNDKLKKFGKLYSGIYLSVFIRIFTVYLAFAAISLIGNILGNISEISSGTSWLVHILLIIAIFKATKELPKLIEDALGMKLGLGDAGKGFGAVLMGTVAGTAGLVGGAIAGGISGGAGGALGGAFTGLTTGVTKGAAAKNAVGVIGASTGAIKGAYGTGLKIRSADGIVGYGLGKIDNFTGRNAGIERKVAEAETKVNAYKDFEEAVYSDYAKQDYIDPITGNKIGKIGTIDDDGDVIAAREALRNYRENTSAPNPTNSPAVAKYNNDIATLRADIKKAEDAYKKKAFDWFDGKSLDTNGNIKYNPSQYSSMSASEKAHYELTKANNKKVLNKGTSADLKTEFDSQNKAAKKAQTELKDQQKSDRYQHAKNIK